MDGDWLRQMLQAATQELEATVHNVNGKNYNLVPPPDFLGALILLQENKLQKQKQKHLQYYLAIRNKRNLHTNLRQIN